MHDLVYEAPRRRSACYGRRRSDACSTRWRRCSAARAGADRAALWERSGYRGGRADAGHQRGQRPHPPLAGARPPSRSAGTVSDEQGVPPSTRSWIVHSVASGSTLEPRWVRRCSAGCAAANGRRVPVRRGAAVRPSRLSPPCWSWCGRPALALRARRPVVVDRCCYDLDGGGEADDGVDRLWPSATPRSTGSGSTRTGTARQASPPATWCGSTAAACPPCRRLRRRAGDHRALLPRLRRRRARRRRAARDRRAARPRGHGGHLRTPRRRHRAAPPPTAFLSDSVPSRQPRFEELVDESDESVRDSSDCWPPPPRRPRCGTRRSDSTAFELPPIEVVGSIQPERPADGRVGRAGPGHHARCRGGGCLRASGAVGCGAAGGRVLDLRRSGKPLQAQHLVAAASTPRRSSACRRGWRSSSTGCG